MMGVMDHLGGGSQAASLSRRPLHPAPPRTPAIATLPIEQEQESTAGRLVGEV